VHTPHLYQRKLLADIKTAYRACVARGVKVPVIAVQLPTGGGKTLVEVVIAMRTVKKNGQCMIATGRQELVLQAAADIRQETPCGVVMAGHPASPELPIQVCSVQTLVARGYAPDGVRVIIFDEGHHLKAATWRSIVAAYQDLEVVFLFTATPIGIGDVADEIVTGPSVRELTAFGSLVRSRVWRPGKATKALARDPLEVLLAHRDRDAVVFAESVEASLELCERARAVGYPIVHVDGDTKNRAELLAKVGRGCSVSNFNVLTEGWNCPPISLCVLACQSGSLIAYLQRVGRVLRACDGKTDALIYDLCGVSHKLGLPDDDRQWTKDSKSGRIVGAIGSATCGRCGFGYRWVPRCPKCGWRSEPRPRVKVKWAELTEAERVAKAPPPERVLAAAMAQAEARGWKPGAVMARFRGVFGRDPSAEERAAARAILEERKVA
jgi:superfamily II DNA or RNA helicase